MNGSRNYYLIGFTMVILINNIKIDRVIKYLINTIIKLFKTF